MRNLKILAIILVMVISSMCSTPQKEGTIDIESKVDLLISSNEPDSLIEGFSMVGDYKMEEYVPRIFEHIDDPRISHHLHFKGLSVYQSKVSALKKISGLEPPRRITYKPDTLIINFYFDWAKEAGFDLADRPG